VNFAADQADPKRRVIGFGAVLLFHALLVWALVSGLAKKVVEIVKAPIETKVIEEVKPPPPPPEVQLPPPPKMEAPPPPFIPPPEIQLQTPPPPAPAITTTPTPPPPAPVVIAPAPPAPVVADAPPAPPAPAPAPAPAVVSASVVCSNFSAVMGEVAYPREAIRQGIERGEAVIAFTLTANGQITNVRTVSATNQIFARNSIRIVGEYKCQGQGRDVNVTVPFGYKLQ
jgi:protein TonB